MQRLLVLERRRGRGGGSADHARQQDLVNQMQSLKLVQQTSKRCPACQMAISKTEGCNKMVCAYCSAAWCWRCERVVKGYEHFRWGASMVLDVPAASISSSCGHLRTSSVHLAIGCPQLGYGRQKQALLPVAANLLPGRVNASCLTRARSTAGTDRCGRQSEPKKSRGAK